MIDKMDTWNWAFKEAVERDLIENLWYIVKLCREEEEKLLVFPGTNGIMIEEIDELEIK